MTQYGFIINLDSCMDHRGCMTGCNKYKDTPMGVYDLECFTNTSGIYPNDECYFIPILCQQCTNPSCVPACPKGVLVKNDKGVIVLTDEDACAKCTDKPCLKACPYGAIRGDVRTGKVYKCDMCENLLDAGKKPACVASCLTHSWFYGDFDDPESPVSQVLAGYDTNMLHQLKPETGNEPNVYYLLTKKPWRDMGNLYSQNWHEQ